MKDRPMNRRYLDTPSTIVAAITAALFIGALFLKGFTHDLFLEAGVLLVSAKILMMMHANHETAVQLDDKMNTILATLARLAHTEKRSGTADDAQDDH